MPRPRSDLVGRWRWRCALCPAKGTAALRRSAEHAYQAHYRLNHGGPRETHPQRP